MTPGAAVDRTTPPETGPPPSIRLPRFERFRLSSGVPVWVMERHTLPEVSVRLVLDAGAGIEAAAESGVADLTASLLTEGAAGRSAQEMARWLDRLGASFSASVSYDAALVSLHLLSDVLEEALDVLRAAVREPAFAPDEVERVRKERLDEIERDRDEPQVVAEEALVAALYGDHPYGRPSAGLYPTVAGLEAGDVGAFHARRYRASDAALVVCGDVEAERLEGLLEARFGDWAPGEEPGEHPEAPDRPRVANRTLLVDRPGSAQSEVRIGGIGVPRSSPDCFPARVANAVVGGLFNSRINMNLREEKGWTYGARTAFRFRRQAGPFVAATAVDTPVTAGAFAEMEAELRGMIGRPPTESELRLAKNALTLSLPRQFETVSQVSRKVAARIIYGLDDDYWERYPERVEAVTPEEVAEVAARYFRPEAMLRLAVGDAGEVADDLEALGPLEVRTP